MRLLLDTHTLLWWLAGDQKLSRKARAAIGDEANEVFVSAASAWEITTKFRIGKLNDASAVATDVEAVIASQGFKTLPVSVAHAQSAGSLPGKLQDPFDRMLVAQAMLEGMTLVTNESKTQFGAYAVKLLW